MMKKVLALLLILTMILSLAGCGKDEEKVDGECKDLEFEITDDNDVSQKIKEKMHEKQKKPYFFTYIDGKDMYIVIGYGPKLTGGYSVQVESVQQCGEEIIVKTKLMTPSKEEVVTQEVSHPSAILKMHKMEGKVKVLSKDTKK